MLHSKQVYATGHRKKSLRPPTRGATIHQRRGRSQHQTYESDAYSNQSRDLRAVRADTTRRVDDFLFSRTRRSALRTITNCVSSQPMSAASRPAPEVPDAWRTGRLGQNTQLNRGRPECDDFLRGIIISSSIPMRGSEVRRRGAGRSICRHLSPADLGNVLTNHAEVEARPPFNMQEAVARRHRMIMKISGTTTNLNAAVSDVRRLVLTEQKARQLGASLDRLNAMTLEAEVSRKSLSAIVNSNGQPVTLAVSNLNLFAAQLPPLANYVNSLVRSNAVGIEAAVKNLEASSATFTNILTDLQNGRGAAGRILRDEELANNVSASLPQNLSNTTSNLNRVGLWGASCGNRKSAAA